MREWLEWTQRALDGGIPRCWRATAPRTADGVNPYCIRLEALFHAAERRRRGDRHGQTPPPAVVTVQAAKLKPGQRLYSNSGSASMGYDLPAAIGAMEGDRRSGADRVICIAGDGSIMMNIQELQTIVGQNLPIKLFVLNNDGYHSIRQTQQNYFPDNVVGCGPESGVTFPDFQKLGHAFGFPVRRATSHDDMASAIAATLDGDGPQLCEVILDKAQPFAPKLSSRRLDDGRMVTSAMEDLAPFLSREELADNMLIPLLEG